jgi:N-acylneuraminate cytidylyltransferase
MKKLAIIPARGGSKRILRKNIRDFLGRPIISYSIDAALKSKLFDEIMVSTDDFEIADTAKQNGASVPFMRSKKNSNDYAGFSEVISEVLNEYGKKNIKFEYFCCILSTASLITPERITEAYKMLIENDFDSVFPAVRYSTPIQRALKIENNNISMFYPENLRKRSQDLKPAYHDSGMFYWMKVDSFIKQKKLYAKKSGAIILSELESQDIDTLEDWKLAEIKYQILFNKK